MITTVHTPTPIRSYSGLKGCMCGCLGKYSEDPVQMAKALKRVLKNPATKYDVNAKCFYYETKTRTNVVYVGELA
jgi:hypothetical protein